MKAYRKFILLFSILLVLYVLTEVYKPKPVDWTVTLSKNDKIPYGGYIVFDQLKTLFPAASIKSFRTPLYSQVNNSEDTNTAYLIISPSFEPSKADLAEMKNYVSRGNYILASANDFGKLFIDSFHLKTSALFSLATTDSTSTNFVNPILKSKPDYGFYRATIDQYFSSIDTLHTIVLGENNHHEPDFIKIPFGDGAFFIQANPICFSNYFLLHQDNAAYASKALSYIPPGISTLYWDEYYKLGRTGATTPLRFLLSNEFLRWALRLSLIGMALYVLFQMKRKQRMIPVADPLRNTTLDFINTVSAVYFNEKDNKSIALKKINYFLEFVRQRFNISTQVLDQTFTKQLSGKSGLAIIDIESLVTMLNQILSQPSVNDHALISLNNKIEQFHKQL